MKYESDGDTDSNWCPWNGPERLCKWTGKVGNRRTDRHYSNYSIPKIGRDTEKTPGNLRRFTVTVTKSSEEPSDNAGVKKNLQGGI